MTKYELSRPGAPWDYPTLGFRADADGAILDGTLFDPELEVPPDAYWSVYGGGDDETDITRYAPPSAGAIPPVPEVSDGYMLAYSDSQNTGVWTSPTDLVEGAFADALSASIDAVVEPVAEDVAELRGFARTNTVIPFGTSITNQDKQGGSTYATGTSDIGYMAWANVLLNHSLRVIRNAGISGNNSTQMLARVQADVIAHAPGWVIVESGCPNDIGAAMTLATSIANHKAVYDACKAAGIRVVVCTPMPYGLNDSGSGGGLTRRQFVSGLRRWQIQYAKEQGHVLADFNAVLAASDGSGLWRGGSSGDDRYSDGANGTSGGTDGIHPWPPAAKEAGKVLADALRPFVPDQKTAWLPGSQMDTWNLLTNGMMTGTSGSTKPTGVTGNLASNWTMFGFTGSGGGGTLSKVARTDGVQGEWQQYVASASTDGLQLQQQNISGLGTTWNIGDLIVCALEYQVDADWTGGTSIGCSLTFHSGLGTITDLHHASSRSGIGQPYGPGVFLLKSTAVPVGTTRLTFNGSCKMTAGTIRWGRAGMWNLTQMVAAGVADTALLTSDWI